MIIIKTVKQKNKKYSMTFVSDWPSYFLVHGKNGPKILCADGIVYYPGSVKMYIIGEVFFGSAIFYGLNEKASNKKVE